MRKIFIVIICLFWGMTNAAAENPEKFKSEKRIFSEYDLNKDGTIEYIPLYKDFSKSLTVYNYKDSEIKEINSKQTVEIDKEISISSPESFIVKNQKGYNILILLYKLNRYAEGRSYNSGNLILFYRLKNTKLELFKEIMTDYVYNEQGDMNSIIEDKYDIGRYPMESVILNDEKTLLLFQGADNIHLIDAKGTISKVNKKIPFMNRIKAFKLKDEKVHAVINKSGTKEYTVWTQEDGNYNDYITTDIEQINNILIDTENNQFILIGKKNRQKHKVTIKYDPDQKRLFDKKEKNVKE